MSAGERGEPHESPIEPDGTILDADAPGVRFLAPAELDFSRTPGGVLRLTLPDVCHRQVTVTCTQPLSEPDGYLSLAVDDQEIGIVRRLSDLDPEQQAMVRAELDKRYFQPVIRRVVELVDRFGAYHWDVETDRGRIAFDAQHPRHSILPLANGRWLVRASDQNRYEIRDLATMDRRSQRILRELLL